MLLKPIVDFILKAQWTQVDIMITTQDMITTTEDNMFLLDRRQQHQDQCLILIKKAVLMLAILDIL